MENTQLLKVQTLKEFAAQKDIASVAPKVRANTNGYPFLTFINSKNEAENVYFSKSAAKAVTIDQPVTVDLMRQFQIGYTTNEIGEERIKLISNSERISIADLF